MMRYVDAYKDRYQIAPTLTPYKQVLQPETHRVALSSMLLQKIDTDPSLDLSSNIKLGSTLSNDHFSDQYFQYQCSNSSFGLSWAKDADKVQQTRTSGKRLRRSLWCRLAQGKRWFYIVFANPHLQVRTP